MKAIVDKDECIGCGQCESVCPQVFKMQDDGKAEADNSDVSGLDDSIQQATDICPVRAITIEY